MKFEDLKVSAYTIYRNCWFHITHSVHVLFLGSFVWRHINLRWLFNAKCILCSGDKRVYTVLKGICPKMNEIVQLEFEVAYYDATISTTLATNFVVRIFKVLLKRILWRYWLIGCTLYHCNLMHDSCVPNHRIYQCRSHWYMMCHLECSYQEAVSCRLKEISLQII